MLFRLPCHAGAFAESLPVICITGGPNTNDFASNRLIHHTLGEPCIVISTSSSAGQADWNPACNAAPLAAFRFPN